ncbi:hypothetical protein L6E12_33510, partial [Actinokineospora sp. PR83]|nr:hypothetical protein [Actinokineospora sp. PR83]
RLARVGVPPRAAARACERGGGDHPRDIGPTAVPQQEVCAFAAAVDRVDTVVLRALANSLIIDHGVVAAWQEVFVPALRDLGARSREATCGVDAARLVGESLSDAFRAVPPPPPCAALAAVLACAPGDPHTLPSTRRRARWPSGTAASTTWARPSRWGT